MMRSLRIWGPLLALAVVVAWSSCGGNDNEVNLFEPLVRDSALDSNEKAQLEEARVLIDQGKHDDATKLLEPLLLKESTDSNEARLLYAAAKLGAAGLDVWEIIIAALESATSGRGGARLQSGGKKSGGIDQILNQITGTVLGEGDEKARKIAALADAVEALLAAPEPSDSKVKNTACIFAGILAVPTLAEGTTTMRAAVDALGQIRSAATSGGAVCPNMSVLDTALSGISTASANLNLILAAAQSCSFLDVDEAAFLMNDVEAALKRLRTNADKGCDVSAISCPAAVPNCQSLFPSCVQTAIGAGSTAQAGDGAIASCEIMLHCTDPTSCF